MSVTMRQMLEAGVHFGHQTRYWNPKMAPFIFGHRNKIHIINLEKTLAMYQDALKFARKVDQPDAQVRALTLIGELRMKSNPVAAKRSFQEASQLAEERVPHLGGGHLQGHRRGRSRTGIRAIRAGGQRSPRAWPRPLHFESDRRSARRAHLGN